MINNNLIGQSITLLINIRRDCCDGRTNIEINDFNSLLISHLIKNDLIVSRISQPGIVNNNKKCYYVGVTDKGRKVCQLIGMY